MSAGEARRITETELGMPSASSVSKLARMRPLASWKQLFFLPVATGLCCSGHCVGVKWRIQAQSPAAVICYYTVCISAIIKGKQLNNSTQRMIKCTTILFHSSCFPVMLNRLRSNEGPAEELYTNKIYWYENENSKF